jgi:hypothetical protein
MHLATLLTGSTAAVVALAMPLAPSTDCKFELAGHVVDVDGVKHGLWDQGRNNIRIIADKIDRKYVVPDTFKVYYGYTCRFYRYVLRNV